MNDLTSKLKKAVDAVRARWSGQPSVGIVLGSGLGELAELIQCEESFEARDIPHYPTSSVIGHRGRFLCGTLHGLTVTVVDGRSHLYEGLTPQEVALPTRLMLELGAQTVVVSNASGGVNPQISTQDIVLLEDHINLMWRNPLIGKNDDELGPRFPDMSAPYDRELIAVAQRTAANAGFDVHTGVYMGFTGPNYETAAEYRMARLLGADVVGMSTIPEVLAARHGGARVFAASVVSNVHSPGAGPVCGHEVVDIVSRTKPQMKDVVLGVLDHIRDETPADSNDD